jgi:ABC-2 type transport system ATP-binding protein
MSERAGPSIEAVDLAKTFRLGFRMKKVDALRGASFSAAPGEIFGFLGPNGAGKTTSIKIIVGLLRPTRGSCSLLGGSPFDLEARRRTGYLPETPYFYDHLLPEEFMDLCGRLRGLSRQERRKRGGELLEVVGLASSKDRPLRKFSKGMLQRIGLAQALIGDPELLILDEPMTGLDPIGRKEVRDLIVDLRKRGKTIFFSSHILADVEMICDRVAIIDKGRVVAEGALADLLSPAVRLVDIELTSVSAELEERIRKLADSVTVERGTHHVAVRGEEATSSVVRLAVEGGARVDAVVPKRETLEALFVRRALGMQEGEEASAPEPPSS